jgi:CheY-like chemotaxis protein
VLVVEDNEINFELVRDLIELSGHQVTWSRGGSSGLITALTEQFDLIVLDLHLPGMSGRSLLKALRAEPSYELVPIVVLTADASPVTGQEVLTDGATAFLTKPFEISVFRAMLAELIS